MKTRFLPILVVIGLVLVLVLAGGTSVPLVRAASYPTTIAQSTQVSAPGGTWNLLLFGGRTPPYVYRGDTWLYDGINWKDATPVGSSPVARSEAAMAYDAARNRVVLFGGLYDIGNDRHFLNDTWEYTNGTWTDVHPSVSPSARGDTQMVYDSRRGVMVLFGGGQNERPNTSCTADNADTDTWEFDGTTWRQVSTAHHPPQFRGGVMAFDEAKDKVVLFTGFQACGYGWQNETWEYDGHDWTRILSSQLGGVLRYDPGMAYDANRQRVVLFGGFQHGGNICLNDTYEYDGVGWLRANTPTTPAGRCSPAMAYEPGLGRVVMFAGAANVPPEDTWEYNGTNWQQVFPQVHPPSRGWSVMAPILVAPPNSAPVLTVDHGVVAVNEGQIAANSGTVSDPDGDLFTLGASKGTVTSNGDGTWSWTLDTTDMPVGYQKVTISTEDSKGGTSQATFRVGMKAPGDTWNLLLFGGRYQPRPYAEITWYGDSWLYDGATWKEAPSDGPGPAARAEATMVYDPVVNRIVLFGGIYDVGSERYYLNDTWQYANGMWTQIGPPDPSADPPPEYPSARGDAHMVYDSRRDVIVLFGGGLNGLPDYCTAENAYVDTWEFDGITWTKIDTTRHPTPFREGAMAYDEARGKVVLFTGFQACGFGWKNETWEYDGYEHDWSPKDKVVFPGTLRYDPGMTYDANRRRVVLFGGFPHGQAGCSLKDTWEYDGAQWTRTSIGAATTGRCAPAMAYDLGLGKVVMFAGGADSPPDDTRGYDGNDWPLLPSQSHPPSRGWSVMAPILVAHVNSAPVLTVDHGVVAVNEGQIAANSGTVSDPDGDAVALSASIGTVTNSGNGTWSWALDTTGMPIGYQTVTISADDGKGGTSQVTFRFRVNAQGSTWNLLLFGGRTPPYVYRGDTWLYDGINWKDATPSDPSPAARSEAAMAYDAARNRVVLFGGLYDIGNDRHFLNDTWEYANGTWSELHPSVSPSARGDTQMVYDARRDVIVLFGGGQNQANTADTDTWEFDGTTWRPLNTAHQPPQFRGGGYGLRPSEGQSRAFHRFPARWIRGERDLGV